MFEQEQFQIQHITHLISVNETVTVIGTSEPSYQKLVVAGTRATNVLIKFAMLLIHATSTVYVQYEYQTNKLHTLGRQAAAIVQFLHVLLRLSGARIYANISANIKGRLCQ